MSIHPCSKQRATHCLSTYPVDRERALHVYPCYRQSRTLLSIYLCTEQKPHCLSIYLLIVNDFDALFVYPRSRQKDDCLFMYAADNEDMLEAAGTLLSKLWQAQPHLVSEFVSQRHLPPLLKRAAKTKQAEDCLVLLRLIHQVWSFTASLVSEPLLLQAIPAIVYCCGRIKVNEGTQASPAVLQLQANLQVGPSHPTNLYT